MNILKEINKKLQNIERLLEEIKNDLKILEKKTEKKEPKIEKLYEKEEELKIECNKLYEKFKNGNTKIIEEFVNSKNKDYLKIFCKVNNFPIDVTKTSKKEIVNQIVNLFNQRRVLTKKIT